MKITVSFTIRMIIKLFTQINMIIVLICLVMISIKILNIVLKWNMKATLTVMSAISKRSGRDSGFR